jgi:hypothetical protein
MASSVLRGVEGVSFRTDLPRLYAPRPGRAYHQAVADDLDSVAARESAHVKARDRKLRGPKVVSVNPGLKKLAQHLADKRKKARDKARQKAEKTRQKAKTPR